MITIIQTIALVVSAIALLGICCALVDLRNLHPRYKAPEESKQGYQYGYQPEDHS